MKKLLFFFFSFPSVALFSQVPLFNSVVDIYEPPVQAIVDPGEYVKGQLLVMLQPDAVNGELEQKFSAAGFTIVEEKCVAKSMRIWLFTFKDGTAIENALAEAKKFPEIEMAQFNHYVAHRVNIPNDVDFPNMWDMNNTGQNGGTPDADIDAPEAWNITTGGMTVQGDTIVVAVIDAGFDLAQQDLNFHKNYAEIPNNGIDDDNNGYIDDYDGWNAYFSNGNISSDMHGTHVSGTVGARGNNSVGVAGVNWGVKIMPVMGSDGTEAQVVEAYTYVLDARRLYNNTTGAQGAFVVSTNSSFGVDQGQPAAYPLWCAMYDSMGAVGILSAAATANANWDIDVVGDIPTACSSIYMIAVTNTTNTDAKYFQAGYGDTTIDIGAPGTSIWSTLPSNTYGTLTGTSMASPHVAGAVALLYAGACNQYITDYKANPSAMAVTTRNYLLNSADHVPSMNGMCTSNGRLNIYNALLAVQSYNCNTDVADVNADGISIAEIFPNPSNGNANIIFNSLSGGTTYVNVYDELGQFARSLAVESNPGVNNISFDLNGLSAGTYFVQLNNGDNFSNRMKIVVQ
ncbi:MAG: S8 family peptidase [Bacteroidetes bacterium]|nr:S8 family peptidase [Bacteroidota bacterium]